jgi:hypothetical protein
MILPTSCQPNLKELFPEAKFTVIDFIQHKKRMTQGNPLRALDAASDK